MLNGHFSNPGAKFSILKEAKKYRHGLSQIVGELYGNGMVWRDLVWDVAKWYGLSLPTLTYQLTLSAMDSSQSFFVKPHLVPFSPKLMLEMIL